MHVSIHYHSAIIMALVNQDKQLVANFSSRMQQDDVGKWASVKPQTVKSSV